MATPLPGRALPLRLWTTPRNRGVAHQDDHWMNDRRRRIARARLLRRQGKTYNEIRVIIGPVDDKTLLLRCKGIPRPGATYRSHPKDDVRRECRRLRAEGLTIPEIAEKTSASKGSISPWVADARVPRAPPPDVGRTTRWRDAGQ